MSYKMNSSNCSLIEDSSENTVVAKLRRLKIEENLLVNSINKLNAKETVEDDIELPLIYNLNLKNYMATLRNSFTEIKYMFRDIKVVTEENLGNIDIENMKRDVIKLDEKIRVFKTHFQSDLISATSQEEVLMKQINDIDDKEIKFTFQSKTRIKQFNQIVPSPVKVMIQSPFKCQEVQQFQEFMKSSPNRYGDWNEYHHNVFTQIWHKYYSVEQIEFSSEHVFKVGNNDQFEDFLKEILQKISGSAYGDLVSHHNWYCKYLYLKQQQKNALNKWKMNKKRSTKSLHKLNASDHKTSKVDKTKLLNSNDAKLFSSIQNVEEVLDTMETRNAEEIVNALCEVTLQEDGLSFSADKNMDTVYCTSSNAIKQKQRSFSDVLKPTKQWQNRCKSSQDSVKGYNNLETIKKLRMPEWRLTLQD